MFTLFQMPGPLGVHTLSVIEKLDLGSEGPERLLAGYCGGG